MIMGRKRGGIPTRCAYCQGPVVDSIVPGERVCANYCQGDPEKPRDDMVETPPHYTQKTIECIEVTEQFGFCLGNAIKYIWRADEKGNKEQDLRKAIWYIERELGATTGGTK